MSRENVEVVRRWLAAISEGPEEALVSLREVCEPDIDYYPVRKFPEATPCHGCDELSQFISGYLDAWNAQWAIQDLIDIGDDRVPGRETMRGEGHGSGIKLEGDLYQCYWLRHRRIFRIEDHLTLGGALHALGLHGEALEALGLSE